jgi:hypothetical protein
VASEYGNSGSADEACCSKDGGASQGAVKNVRRIAHARGKCKLAVELIDCRRSWGKWRIVQKKKFGDPKFTG